MNAVNFRGWLLDLYLNQQDGLTLWFISETDDRRVFHAGFSGGGLRCRTARGAAPAVETPAQGKLRQHA